MAGKPKLKAALAALDKRGGAEALQNELLSGKTIPMIAKELGLDKGYLRRNLMKHDVYGPAIAEVVEQMADAHAEAGFEYLDALRERRAQEIAEAQSGERDQYEGNVSQVDLGIAKAYANQHNFIATAYNKSRYGSGQQANVTINIGDLHLDALRKIKVVEHE